MLFFQKQLNEEKSCGLSLKRFCVCQPVKQNGTLIVGLTKRDDDNETVQKHMHFQGQPTLMNTAATEIKHYLLTRFQINKLIHESYDYLDRLKHE